MVSLKTKQTWVHLINVFTHAHGIVYLFQHGVFSILDALLVTSLMASCFMHLSERKHNLPGLFGLGSYANLFLNIDRVAAVLFGLSIASLTVTWQHESLRLFLTLVVFAVWCSVIGELTNNLLIYTVCHSIWHIIVFQEACQAIYRFHLQPSNEATFIVSLIDHSKVMQYIYA